MNPVVVSMFSSVRVYSSKCQAAVYFNVCMGFGKFTEVMPCQN